MSRSKRSLCVTLAEQFATSCVIVAVSTSALLLFCPSISGGEGLLSVENLRFAISEFDARCMSDFKCPFRKRGGISGNWIYFLALEDDRRDLNSDGDRLDSVVHVFDLESGRARNLQLASVALPSRSWWYSQIADSGVLLGNQLVFTVSESDHGEQDLNGDDDARDHVWHVHDLDAEETTNLRLSGDPTAPPIAVQDRVLFRVSEQSEGRDLNQDGDVGGLIWHVYNSTLGKVDNDSTVTTLGGGIVGPGIEVGTSSFTGAWADWVVLRLNDGSSEAHNLNTGEVVPLEGSSLAVVGSFVLLGDWEHAFNAEFLKLHDLATQEPTDLGVLPDTSDGCFGPPLAWDNRRIAFLMAEDMRGQDLNGDGDMHDDVVHVYDVASEELRNLGYDSDGCVPHLALAGDFIVFETARGSLLMVHDYPENVTEDLGESFGFRIGQDWIAFTAISQTLRVHNLERNEGAPVASPRDGLSTRFSLANDDWLLYSFRQPFRLPRAHEDLEVIVVPDLEQPDQRLVVSGGVLGTSASAMAFGMAEWSNGGQDLNGDGDTDDVILHVAQRGAANLFLRGDCNDDGTVDISDAVTTLGSLFLGNGDPGCDDACDSNDDGTVDISDAIATLGVLFLGNGVIPVPGTDSCGIDPTRDELSCEIRDRCP